MNKTELVDAIALESGLSKADSARALSACLDTITEVLADGNTLVLPGFGTFSVSKRSARTGRNPQTGAVIKIAATKAAKFKAGKKLKEAVR
jgi:DNA-binding protein HU-beta